MVTPEGGAGMMVTFTATEGGPTIVIENGVMRPATAEEIAELAEPFAPRRTLWDTLLKMLRLRP